MAAQRHGDVLSTLGGNLRVAARRAGALAPCPVSCRAPRGLGQVIAAARERGPSAETGSEAVTSAFVTFAFVSYPLQNQTLWLLRQAGD